MKRNFSRFAGCLALAALLTAGCAPTETKRSTGQYLDDKTVSTKVKAALVRDEGLKGATDVEVETFRGTVQLSGFVDSKEMADKAVAAARSVEGVEAVKNDMRIRSKTQ